MSALASETQLSGSDGPSWLPALLPFVSLLPNVAAALPGRTYYFRDFTLTYVPLRAFFAREVAAGRWPFWNRLLHEGCPFLPVVYPLELAQLLWPGPATVSWLLTLHIPLAALCCYALARALGSSRWAAFASGAVYAMGGLSLSSLNLHWFLEALALAPAVILTTRRAAVRGGRDLPLAGLVLALSISTLAVEFVAQAFVIGAVLGLVEEPTRRGLARVTVAATLGLGVAGLPVALMLGILHESARGAGTPAALALQNSLHPLLALQALVPDLAGSVADPLRAWWGRRLYAGGSPYFLTLYVGPVALALAAHGTAMFAQRTRQALLVVSALAILYALGPEGGLANAMHPILRWFRFPIKALLTPYLCLALFAGAGLDRLRQGRAPARLVIGSAVAGALLAAVLLVARFGHSAVASWLDISPRSEALMTATWLRESAAGLALALATGFAAAQRARLGVRSSACVVLALLVLDLWRGGIGVNPQTTRDFFAPPAGLLSLIGDLGGGRVFSLGVDASPAMESFENRHQPGVGLSSFLVSRRVLTPFTNLLDGLEVAEGSDRLSFVPTRPPLPAEAYGPGAIGGILPRLRDDAVTRVVSLDPLRHPGLRLLGSVPAGPPGMEIRVYDLLDPLPRTYVACLAGGAGEGVGCGAVSGRVLNGRWESYETRTEAPALFVTRDSYTRSWTATVDGRPAPVLRVDGWKRGVPVPPGDHHVELVYRPPGLLSGTLAMVISLCLGLLLWIRPTLERGSREVRA